MITDVGTEGLHLEESIIRESRKKNIKIYIAFVPNCQFEDLCKHSMPSYKKISEGRIYNLTKAADFDSKKFINDVIFQVRNENKNNFFLMNSHFRPWILEFTITVSFNFSAQVKHTC